MLASAGDGMTEAIFGQLRPFELELLVNGQVPEDSWTRIARHWHNYYRLSHPVPAGHPKAATRLPWTEIDPFIRQDNLLQVHSILSSRSARQDGDGCRLAQCSQAASSS